jgi:hypothetical protein
MSDIVVPGEKAPATREQIDAVMKARGPKQAILQNFFLHQGERRNVLAASGGRGEASFGSRSYCVDSMGR